jgi:dihydrofolate synthase / folylpolyglutamate synthase
MNQKYNSILEEFFHTEKITEYSLDKIRSACEYFGNPQDSFQSIHIAWTNGKGSTAKMIFQILKDAGKSVGVYTSPHNIDIRERFEAESGLILEEDFARLAGEIIEYGHELSYFEKCVLLAFLYFREQGCEYVVIEVGMGGRLDATNIITPILSIITSISYDHMEFLWDTLEKIAYEKWGVIKSWVPVILYDRNPILEQIAHERGARVIFPKQRGIHTNLLGEYQISNWQLAYEAGVFLWIAGDIVSDALLHVDHHGRLEYIYPNLLIDGAHNQDGLQKLKTYLHSLDRREDDIVYCINLKRWKQITLVTDIFPNVHNWILVDSSHQMVEDPIFLAKQLQWSEITCTFMTPHRIIEATKKNPEKLFVVFGSLYMIGEFLDTNTH